MANVDGARTDWTDDAPPPLFVTWRRAARDSGPPLPAARRPAPISARAAAGDGMGRHGKSGREWEDCRLGIEDATGAQTAPLSRRQGRSWAKGAIGQRIR
eukprot:8830613-Pyramimonas_sp.AAC.2